MSTYSELTKEEKIERFLDVLVEYLQGRGEVETWPVNPAQVEPYYVDLAAIDFFKKFQANRSRFKEALLCLRANVLRSMSHSTFILGLKSAKVYGKYPITSEQIVNFVNFIFETFEAKVQSDPLGLDKKLLIWEPSKTEQFLKDNPMMTVSSRSIQKQLSALAIDAESLCWSYYLDIYVNTGMNIHGVYETSKGDLLVKEFYLEPRELWPVKNPFSPIQLYFLYEAPSRIFLSYTAHPYYSTSPRLRSFLCLVSGERVEDMNKIKKIDNFLIELRRKQVNRVERLKPKELIDKAAQIYYFRLKPFFDFYGEPDKPPSEFYDRLEKWGLRFFERFRGEKGKGTTDPTWIRRMWDPRNDFVG